MKRKGFIAEFKEFIMRGNVLDLAVGVIIGGAFQNIVSSLVEDIIMPLVRMATGGIDFKNWFISLNGHHYNTLADAAAAKAPTLNFGVFITSILQFLIMALVIFMLIKVLNKITATAKHINGIQEEATTKICPYCKFEIDIDATRCPHCTSVLDEAETEI